MLGDMLLQMWKYFNSGWQMNDFQLRRQQYLAFVKILDAMNVAYLLTHMVMVVQALLWRNQERTLLSQLPPIGVGISLTNMRIHLAVDCIITGSTLLMGVVNSIQAKQTIANMRYLYSTQAVRARCLQVALLVMRLDAQLLTLQAQLSNGRRCNLELRATYAHIVRLTRKISDLYGLSVLLMNMLCIGDFIMVCYAYIVLWEITDTNLSWLLIWQGFYVLLPTTMKIWILCAACHNCAKHSEQLQTLLRGSCKENRTIYGIDLRASRDQTNEFALQIMQNPVHFDVCGIYHLNLKTLAGMFLFILESLVIFLQFVALVKQQSI
ncbi:putative gustatory receptor 9a [Drosophila innubila]|uniref:putative gustatory receptor 9a n=1 Tax=Drosophila innubila TaxID=198719 RepID=UPI00148E3B27|nr:putative gustatory receptor 9a [Drosophila innubila]